mmetsp:Transcript_92424/g.211587  ORF Transcript_92424/g.211587 Transcript_92424/m.211587 type:complete len:516 (-) Transcript_92424:50-1597(-)
MSERPVQPGGRGSWWSSLSAFGSDIANVMNFQVRPSPPPAPAPRPRRQPSEMEVAALHSKQGEPRFRSAAVQHADHSPTVVKKFRSTPSHAAESEFRPSQGEVGRKLPNGNTGGEWQTTQKQGFYCTPLGHVPGMITVTQACIQFEPDPRVQEVHDHGLDCFQVFIEMADVLECGAISVPADEIGFPGTSTQIAFLQLHLRSEKRSRKADKRDASCDNSRVVVFKVGDRETLNELAIMLVDFVELFRGGPSPARTLTSVPHWAAADGIEALMVPRSTGSAQRALSPDVPAADAAVSSEVTGTSTTALVNGDRIVEASFGDFARTQIRFPANHSDALLLSVDFAAELLWHLPISLRFQRWECVYAPRLHGVSLQTLYRHFESRDSPSVMLIHDTDDHVMGCFASEGWKNAGKYYGTGESFVFSFGQVPLRMTVDGLRPKEALSCQAFSWTSRNSFFMFSDDTVLAIGGGGHYALTVDCDFLRGTSAPCSTFESPCLSSKSEFVVKTIEFWGFVDAD